MKLFQKLDTSGILRTTSELSGASRGMMLYGWNASERFASNSISFLNCICRMKISNMVSYVFRVTVSDYKAQHYLKTHDKTRTKSSLLHFMITA
jgi:hypothetical protein